MAFVRQRVVWTQREDIGYSSVLMNAAEELHFHCIEDRGGKIGTFESTDCRWVYMLGAWVRPICCSAWEPQNPTEAFARAA